MRREWVVNYSGIPGPSGTVPGVWHQIITHNSFLYTAYTDWNQSRGTTQSAGPGFWPRRTGKKIKNLNGSNFPWKHPIFILASFFCQKLVFLCLGGWGSGGPSCMLPEPKSDPESSEFVWVWHQIPEKKTITQWPGIRWIRIRKLLIASVVWMLPEVPLYQPECGVPP